MHNRLRQGVRQGQLNSCIFKNRLKLLKTVCRQRVPDSEITVANCSVVNCVCILCFCHTALCVILL